MEIVELKETEMLETRQKVKELKAADFILLMLFGYNRSIRRFGVKRLMRSVKETGCFLEPIKYITAATYFAFYPEREIRLESGKVINKDSEGLDKILFVLDGQHRIEADNELEIEDKNYQSTLEAEQVILPENVTPDMWMTTVNNNKLNWNERDRAGYIISVRPKEETNISVVNQLRNGYGISERYGYSLLNLYDGYRKKLYEDYMRHPEKGLHSVLRGTPENRKRGLEILHALEVGFRNYPKVIRNMAVINFVIEIYNETSDKNKEKIVKVLQSFFMALPEATVTEISDTNDKSRRIDILRKAWRKFLRRVKQADEAEQIMDITINAEREWAAMMETSKKKTNHKQIQ